jgi:hypothetical protein
LTNSSAKGCRGDAGGGGGGGGGGGHTDGGRLLELQKKIHQRNLEFATAVREPLLSLEKSGKPVMPDEKTSACSNQKLEPMSSHGKSNVAQSKEQ